jgi:hypothetical protein
MKTKLTKISMLLMAFAISIQLQAITQSPQKALNFNGSTQYVSGTTGISTSLTAITIEAWVNHSTLPTGAIQRYVTIQPEVAVLRYDGSGLGGTNELHFYIKNASGTIVSLRVDNVLSTGTWMHIAGTYDGTTMKLYLNGKLLKSGAAVGLTAPSGAFLFGANGAEAFNGKMDEVSVWNYARSMADIREDMYRNAPTANANLINYWQFNNGSGTTLTDMKGTATGTLNNMDNTNWIASTIPFAAGAVNTQRVTTTGTTTFTGTGLVANFTAKSGTDTIVASRIDTLANVSPTDVTTAFNSQYWVINRFGTGTFTSNLTFTVNDDITSVQAAHPNLLKLYKRESNNDGSWTLVAAATSADDVNNTVTFNGLTSFDGQYMVCFSSPTNTVGTALNFDGTNDYVDCGNASSLNVSKITIEAWINADTWNANSYGGTIVSKDNTNGFGYSLRCGNNGMLSFVIGVSGGWHELLSGAVMQTGRWNYVVGVYDGSNMSIYVNGVRAGQQYITGSIAVSSQSLLIGNSPGYPTRFFDGKIDEVRLFNVARTEAQIRSDMCNTLTGTETGLVNYWQFNNGSGTTLTDVVGSSTGTLTNMDAATSWVESYAMVVPAPTAASSSFTTGFTANWTAPAIGTVTSYKLDVSTNNTFTALVSGYNDLDCGNNLSKDVTGLTNGTTYYYRVRADKTSVTGTGGNHYTYTTYAPTVINTQSTASQEVCLNQVFTAISVSATGDNLSYQWYSNTSNSNSDGSSLNSANGAQTNTYKPQQGTTPGILYYYCVVTGNHGTATSAVSGEFVTRPPIITSQSTAAQTQPIYGTFTPITVTVVGANLTYQWYSNASAFNSGGTSLGTDNGAQTNSYTPQVTTAGTLYYYCIVTGACGPVTSQVSGAFIVNPIELAGSGTAGDPYRIANLNNLYYLSTTPYLWDKGYTFIQTANINAAETRNWDGGQGFTPIGNRNVKFQGNYHGKGNSIDSLYINRPGSQEVAFFGYIYQTPSGVKSSIDSLSLTNVNITGKQSVGGLGGMAHDFNISHCSVIGGSVTATNSDYSAGVGGMFGTTDGYYANNNSTSHCFAAVAVSGQGEVGGFVGQTYGGYINQCYSAGSVSGTGEYVGGFVGYRMSLGNIYSLDSSYYDIQASGQATGAGRNDQPAYNHLQGKTTAEMKTQATYDGWNFSTVWKISGSVNNGYPYFDYPTQISTATVSNIANSTATATGSINHIGALAITAHGFCWNTTGTPTLADGKINLGATTTSADYSGSITGLSHNTTYYLRAYAIDANDTIYGNVVNFTTTNVITGGTCIKVTTPPSGAIRIPDNNGLNLTNNYSIEAWINPDAYHADSKKYFLRKGLFTGTKVSGYYLARTGGGNSLGLVFDDMITADNILSEGKWNHIAAVNDNGTRHIYVNGVEYPLTGTPKTVIANSDPLFIGSSQKAGSMSPFTGKFDEISVWNTALSESQVREHIHFPLAGTETGLVSYWQCDEGSGGTVSDKMGINNGAIVRLNDQYVDDYVVDTNPNPKWFVSTIPFGLGYSNTQVVTATGTNTFTNAGLAMNFTAKTGMDSIVVARIDSFPNINPTGLNAVFDRQYWAVHKYGTGTLTANLTFTISEGFTADDQSVPSKIKLYKRGSMADDSTWVYVASASTVNATTKQATFNGISDFSQFIIARGACVVYIPDANFRAALLANASINTNGDNEIQCTEAAAFTGTIDVTSANIADMTGIEAFTNITELYCANNLLTTLNVSNNTALTYLYCNGNQLTSLDVSANTALLYLLCDHNQLTSLNVSSIAPLKQLHCNNNALSNLDVSLNTALLALNCQYNSLTSLNVKNGHNTSLQTFVASNNPGLSCIQVDDAIYSATHWLSKDAGASYSTSCGMVTETMGIAKTVWSVYPNPVSDELIIEAENMNENSRYEFINSVGQVISAGTLMTKTSVQTSHFPMGIYLLKVGNGKTFDIRKIVKK